MSAWLAPGGSIIAIGSPGAMRITTKTTTATPNRVTAMVSRRLRNLVRSCIPLISLAECGAGLASIVRPSRLALPTALAFLVRSGKAPTVLILRCEPARVAERHRRARWASLEARMHGAASLPPRSRPSPSTRPSRVVSPAPMPSCPGSRRGHQCRQQRTGDVRHHLDILRMHDRLGVLEKRDDIGLLRNQLVDGLPAGDALLLVLLAPQGIDGVDQVLRIPDRMRARPVHGEAGRGGRIADGVAPIVECGRGELV